MGQDKITDNRKINTFGSRLRTARKSRGWSQAHLAKEIGAKRGAVTISEWERNRYMPSVENVTKLCNALGASFEWLMGESPEAGMVREQVLPHGAPETKLPWILDDAISKAHRVLTSSTSYADALYVNIVHFDRALDAEERVQEMERNQQKQSEDLSAIREELDKMNSQLQSIKNENSELKKELSSGKNSEELKTTQHPTSRKTE